MKKHLTIILALCSTLIHGQTFKGRDTLGLTYAKKILARYPSANDSTRYFYKHPRQHLCLLPDSATAVKVAIPILIKVYGKELIEKWKPFEVYSISNYWFISGTDKKRKSPVTPTGGDPFIIILDAYNSRVIDIIVGE